MSERETLRNEGVGWMVAFIGGFLLGSLLTGGVFGTYLLFGASRYREAEMMARMEAERAMMEAQRARMIAEEQEAKARAERDKVEEQLRKAEEAEKKP
jgi:3-deoxy-D-manno-octulosonic-acid transferase